MLPELDSEAGLIAAKPFPAPIVDSVAEAFRLYDCQRPDRFDEPNVRHAARFGYPSVVDKRNYHMPLEIITCRWSSKVSSQPRYASCPPEGSDKIAAA